MYVELSDGEKIELPNDKRTYEERLAVVNEVMAKYPEQFIYDDTKEVEHKCGKRIMVNRGTEYRIETLGTYLLKTDADHLTDTMSEHKQRFRPQQERSFSTLSQEQQMNLGVYESAMVN